MNGGVLSLRGRVARLPYFGYSLAIFSLVLVLIGGGGTVIYYGRTGSDPMGAWVVGGVLIVFGVVLGWWIHFALLIKRLHDIGLPGTHAIWIILLSFAGSAVFRPTPAVGILLWLTSFGVGLWLLFQPGTPGPNRYGAPSS